MDYSSYIREGTPFFVCDPPAPYHSDTWKKLAFSEAYMYAMVMENKEIVKGVVELLWDVKLNNVEINSEKNIFNGQIAKDIRLDALLTDEMNRQFAVEMENGINYLLERSDYYSSILGVYALRKGETYKNLKGTYVVFICTKDPFGDDVPIIDYEFISSIPGRKKIQRYIKFVNVKAYQKVQNKELREFMAYVDHEELSDNKLVQMIDKEVRSIKKNRGKVETIMTLWEREWLAREEGIKEGIKEGEEKHRKVSIRNLSLVIQLKYNQKAKSWLETLSLEQLEKVSECVMDADTFEELKQLVES